jgi:hypothetical protein
MKESERLPIHIHFLFFFFDKYIHFLFITIIVNVVYVAILVGMEM